MPAKIKFLKNSQNFKKSFNKKDEALYLLFNSKIYETEF